MSKAILQSKMKQKPEKQSITVCKCTVVQPKMKDSVPNNVWEQCDPCRELGVSTIPYEFWTRHLDAVDQHLARQLEESGYAMQPLVLNINEGKKHPLSAFSFNIL